MSNRYDTLIRKVTLERGMSFSLLKALVAVESNFNPRAKSFKGAMGLGQIMPRTAKELEIKNPYDPEENLRGVVKYFEWLLKRPGVRGDVERALSAYNIGIGRVQRHVSRKVSGRFPKQTERYVSNVLRYEKLYEA